MSQEDNDAALRQNTQYNQHSYPYMYGNNDHHAFESPSMNHGHNNVHFASHQMPGMDMHSYDTMQRSTGAGLGQNYYTNVPTTTGKLLDNLDMSLLNNTSHFGTSHLDKYSPLPHVPDTPNNISAENALANMSMQRYDELYDQYNNLDDPDENNDNQLGNTTDLQMLGANNSLLMMSNNNIILHNMNHGHSMHGGQLAHAPNYQQQQLQHGAGMNDQYEDEDGSEDMNDGDLIDFAQGHSSSLAGGTVEHVGRWTQQEHERFINGLKLHGKNWKKVAAVVHTRTVVQTRTHAQKYFQKANRQSNGEPVAAPVRSQPQAAVVQPAAAVNMTGANSYSQLQNAGTMNSLNQQQNKRNLSLSPPTIGQLAGYSAMPIGTNYPNPTAINTNPTGAGVSSMNTVAQQGNNKKVRITSTSNTTTGNTTTGSNLNLNGSNVNSNTNFGYQPPLFNTPSSMNYLLIGANNPNTLPQPSPAACGSRRDDELSVAQALANSSTKPSFRLELLDHDEDVGYNPLLEYSGNIVLNSDNYHHNTYNYPSSGTTSGGGSAFGFQDVGAQHSTGQHHGYGHSATGTGSSVLTHGNEPFDVVKEAQLLLTQLRNTKSQPGEVIRQRSLSMCKGNSGSGGSLSSIGEGTTGASTSDTHSATTSNTAGGATSTTNSTVPPHLGLSIQVDHDYVHHTPAHSTMYIPPTPWDSAVKQLNYQTAIAGAANTVSNTSTTSGSNSSNTTNSQPFARVNESTANSAVNGSTTNAAALNNAAITQLRHVISCCDVIGLKNLLLYGEGILPVMSTEGGSSNASNNNNNSNESIESKAPLSAVVSSLNGNKSTTPPPTAGTGVSLSSMTDTNHSQPSSQLLPMSSPMQSIMKSRSNSTLGVASALASLSNDLEMSIPETESNLSSTLPDIEHRIRSGSISNPSVVVSRVINRPDASGKTPLILAVSGGQSSSSFPNTGGTTTNASGGTLAGPSEMYDMCVFLINFGASPKATDHQNRTCLHYLAELGYEKSGTLLLSHGCPINAVDRLGNTALHYAMIHGHVVFVQLLVHLGANCHIRNYQSCSALDSIGYHSLPGSSSTLSLGTNNSNVNSSNEVTIGVANEDRSSMRRVLLSAEPRLRTLVLYHDDCLEHAAVRLSDWEGPNRLTGIMQKILDAREFPEYELEITNQFDKASVELLSRVHASEYITLVDSLAKSILKQEFDQGNEQNSGQGHSGGSNVSGHSNNDQKVPFSVPFTPQVQRVVLHQAVEHLKKSEYCDTQFSGGTLLAARRAAGAVPHAIDRVLLGRNRNAFCCIRPPGHHAGYRGLLDNAKSCGFCIFNNIAAGALHALTKHNCERVAIIDIDVHHGNGTEEIVRRYRDPSRLLFFSVHLYDRDEAHGNEFFPGSGVDNDMSHNIINIPIQPIWHAETLGADTGSVLTSGNSSTHALDEPPMLKGRAGFRHAIKTRLIPALRAFNPSLILLSTGFDTMEKDVGNSRNGDAGLNLTLEDIAWTTASIMKVADVCCQGRVVSVLEGGYGSLAQQQTQLNKQSNSGGNTNVYKKEFATTRNTRHNSNNANTSTNTSVNESTVHASPDNPSSPGTVGLNRCVLVNAAVAHIHTLVDPYGCLPPPPYPLSNYHP